MKNLTGIIQGIILGVGITSTTIFGGYSLIQNNRKPPIEKTILEFTREDFKDEKVFMGTRLSGEKLYMNFKTPVVYDLDKNKKRIIDSKAFQDTKIFERLKEEGYDFQVDMDYKSLIPLNELGKEAFVLGEEYLELNEKGEPNFKKILDKIKRIDKEECKKNIDIEREEKAYLNRLYVLRTKEESVFFLRIKERDKMNRRVVIESYKVNRDYISKEDRQ